MDTTAVPGFEYNMMMPMLLDYRAEEQEHYWKRGARNVGTADSA